VFLDYCGCRKHWHDKGIPTGLNKIQLDKILSRDNNEPNKNEESKELVSLESMT
jgi:hypothetical protein